MPPTSTSFQILNPRTQGTLPNRIRKKFAMTDRILDQPRLSINVRTRFSHTAVTVEKLAKTIKRKNRAPQILPPSISTKILGRVSKIREGP